MLRITRIFLLSALILISFSMAAFAQRAVIVKKQPEVTEEAPKDKPAQQEVAISKVTIANVVNVSRNCVSENWETPECLRAVSRSNLIMAADYGAGLQKSGQAAAAEILRQHCAASTAARETDYPAYAMQSAFVECANAIQEIVKQTKIVPDLNLYQLLVGASLCIAKDARCPSINEGLVRFQ